MILHLTSLLFELQPGLQQGYSPLRIRRDIFFGFIMTVQELLAPKSLQTIMIHKHVSRWGFGSKESAGLIKIML